MDLDALCANAEHVGRAAGPGVALLPMIKADAYGLGLVAVARALAASLPARSLAGFGVATVAEGETLRAAGWPGRIVAFSPAAPGEYPRAAAADLVLCFSELEALRRWAREATRLGRRLAFHTEVDTGMGRAGFRWDQARDWGGEVARLADGRLRWEGCFTHFHSADEPDLRPTLEQWRLFRVAVDALPMQPPGEPARVLHTANSAASLRCDFRCDWVRPGIFLYGGRVGAEPPAPVASVRARIVLVREVPSGATAGYGATYAAMRSERWGTLAIGYGDGLPRRLGPAGGRVLIAGRRVPIIGRISMDMVVVDLTDAGAVQAGDVATLVGCDGEAEITVDEVASLTGTISYEILTGLTPRLPRVYTGQRRVPAGFTAGPPPPRVAGPEAARLDTAR